MSSENQGIEPTGNPASRPRVTTGELDTPEPGESPLARMEEEPEDEHRAFLLWAMQAPGKRSRRAVSRATGISEPTLRRRGKQWNWRGRVREAGGEVGADIVAWRQYLHDYAKTYRLEGVGEVQPNMRIPGPDTPLGALRKAMGEDAEASQYEEDSIVRAVLEEVEDAGVEITGGRAAAPADPRPSSGAPSLASRAISPPEGPTPRVSGRERRKAQLMGLLEATLGIYAKEAKLTLESLSVASSGLHGKGLTEEDERKRRHASAVLRNLPLKVRAGDLPKIAEMMEVLESYHDNDRKGPQESVRVRLTRESGGDVLEALAIDHGELGAILQAVANKRAQEGEHLRMEAEVRRGQADRGAAHLGS